MIARVCGSFLARLTIWQRSRVLAQWPKGDLREKFCPEIHSGRVIIIDKAIGSHRGPARFFMHSFSPWGTFSPAFADRNAREGAKILLRS
jgi:hypothetical protein